MRSPPNLSAAKLKSGLENKRLVVAHDGSARIAAAQFLLTRLIVFGSALRQFYAGITPRWCVQDVSGATILRPSTYPMSAAGLRHLMAWSRCDAQVKL